MRGQVLAGIVMLVGAPLIAFAPSAPIQATVFVVCNVLSFIAGHQCERYECGPQRRGEVTR